MSLINVTNLTFGYDGSYDNVFENVSFQIDTDWKLGFIGRNGRGKTTFLNLLLGKYAYQATISSSATFEYFPYTAKDMSQFTIEVVQSICPYAEDWEILKEVSMLDLDAETLYRPFETLSNGERTKVLLVALFLGSNRFLLIDEPTNHLDTETRKKVGSYLQRKKGFILVSHDRELLDTCIDHVLSINLTNIEIQQGNFSSWWENKKRQDEFELCENEKRRKEIDRLSQASKRLSSWPDKVESTKNGTTNSGSKLDKGFVGHKSSKMMKRAKSQESRMQTKIEVKSKLLKNVEQTDTLKRIMFWSFLIGNALYYTIGIWLAIALKDNRAFCKYVCPITVFLKPMSYFSLMRIRVDTEKCVSCGKCKKACPMNVDMTDNLRRRVNGTECILCLECIEECPKKALHL